MSRAFRDAFTQLICQSINRSRQERLPLQVPQLISKPYNNNNNRFELNNTSAAMNNTCIEILPPSTVILNPTTTETPMSLTPSTTPCHIISDGKKHSICSLGKQVLFRNDVNTSTNTKFTDL